MNSKIICLAVDLGASSGRVVAGIYDGARLELNELHRFPNDPVKQADGWHWNLDQLFAQIKQGLALAAREYGDAVQSVGVDTWGVDYGMLDAEGKLLGAPFQYRDARTEGMQEAAFRRMPREEIYRRTGIQFMFFNTLFQLLAEAKSGGRLEKAERLLFMPDLINYFLTGVAASEKSIASTSQLLNPRTQTWERNVIQAMGLPEKVFGRLVDAGSVLGELRPEVSAETGAKRLRVIAPAEHDTASAVAGVPADEAEPVFLSSGTWSCMGRELNQPVISDESFREAFSNEGGALGKTRFLKNIAGLWLLQESKRIWDAAGKGGANQLLPRRSPVARQEPRPTEAKAVGRGSCGAGPSKTDLRPGKAISYADLVALAEKSPPFASFVDPDAASFQAPTDMPAAIGEFCRRTGQRTPADSGAVTRLILEGLALKYRLVKESLAQVTGKPVGKIYIVGGGSQNDLLNQFAANAMNCVVAAGPVEATSIGNIVLQLTALGEVHSLAEGRALVRRSFEPRIFEPKDTAAWDEALARFQKILSTAPP